MGKGGLTGSALGDKRGRIRRKIYRVEAEIIRVVNEKKNREIKKKLI